MMTVLLLTVIGALSTVFTALFRRYALQKNLIDHPNNRSSHLQPTPRGGGIIFSGLWVFSSLLLISLQAIPLELFAVFIFPAVIIAFVGYWDDVKNLSAKHRFVIQLAASAIMLYGLQSHLPIGLTYLTHAILLVLLLLATVWSINLFNFLDGTDGYAAVEAIFFFGTSGFLFWQCHAAAYVILALLLVAVVLGFLVWNWPAAKIFMGDVGSGFLGFLIVPFALVGQLQYHISLWIFFILYLGFSMDATLTLLRRILHGEKWYQAHKSHAYQRLHQAGLSHGQVLMCLIVFNSVLTLLAVYSFYHINHLRICVIAAIMCGFFAYLWVEKKYPMFKDPMLGKSQHYENRA